MKKTLSLMLMLFMLLPLCAACGESKENADVQTPAPGVEESPDTPVEAEPETTIYESALASLPGEKYGGRNFTILTRGKELFEMDAEDLTGETTNDAVYNRNRLAEETCDIVITAEDAGMWDDVTNKMKASVTAGDYLYNMIGQVDFKTYAIVGAGLCGNWLDIPAISFDAPWWTKAANDEATINGILFTFTGDFCVTNILYGNVLFYNAKLCENYGITASSLQDMVFEKKWTYDTFDSLLSGIYEDANGNTQKDAEDIYGIALAPDAHCDEWLTAFAQPLTAVSKDGVIEVVMFTDKTVTALGKVLALYYENAGTFNPGSWKTDATYDLFVSDRALFTSGILNDARASFAGMESDFGVLPYPMWDEAQDTYYTVASDQFSVIAFPINTPEEDYGFLGTVTELLGILSKRDVVPAFYDSALKNRYSMDENTARIIDLIMDGRLFEFSFQYGNDIEIPYIFRNQIIGNSSDIMSYWKSKQKIVTKTLGKIAKYYGLEG